MPEKSHPKKNKDAEFAGGYRLQSREHVQKLKQ